MDFVAITIDGPAGAGKSTAASLVAKKLKFYSLNVGEIYRAITYKYLAIGSPKLETEEDITYLLSTLSIKVKYIDSVQHTFSDGKDITKELHTQPINNVVSIVSPHPRIRQYVIKIQREIAQNNNIVADGRDVGTNVLPDAKFKFYLTASVQVRAKRRLLELLQDGDKTATYAQIEKELIKRDEDDTKREHGKLKMAEDAVLVDTSYITIEEVVDQIVSIVEKGMGKK